MSGETASFAGESLAAEAGEGGVNAEFLPPQDG